MANQRGSCCCRGVGRGARPTRPNATLLEMVLWITLDDGTDLLARGYVRGLMSEHPRHADRLIEWLDANEHERPENTAAIAISAGAPVGALGRVLRLFDKGRVPIGYLNPANFGRLDELNDEDVALLFERFATATDQGDERAQRIALDSLARVLPRDLEEAPPPLLVEVPRLIEFIGRSSESTPADEAPESYWWGTVAAAMANHDPGRAAEFAARLLGHGPVGAEDQVQQVLSVVSRQDPQITMEALGRVMLDDTGRLALPHWDLSEPVRIDTGSSQDGVAGTGGRRGGPKDCQAFWYPRTSIRMTTLWCRLSPNGC